MTNGIVVSKKKQLVGRFLYPTLATLSFVLFFVALAWPTRIEDESCWVFVNRNGKAISEKFELAMPFSEGLAPVQRNKLWGYIDTKGRWVIAPKFSVADPFHEGFASVVFNDTVVFIDKQGKLLTKKSFSRALGFKNGYAVVAVRTSEGERFGYLNSKGEYEIPPKYRKDKLPNLQVEVLKSSKSKNVSILRLIRKGGVFGYENREGRVVVEPIFSDAQDFSCGLAAVKTESGLYGYIDENGQMKISAQFKIALPFSEGLAVVGEPTNNWDDQTGQPMKKLGIIDKNGNFVVPKILRSASSYVDGCSLVQPIDCSALNY